MTTMTTASNNEKEVPESALNDLSIVELRFRDIEGEEPFNFQNYENMLSAIKLVRSVGYNLPDIISADLQIRVFKLFKNIQDQIKEFQDGFKPTLPTQIENH